MSNCCGNQDCKFLHISQELLDGMIAMAVHLEQERCAALAEGGEKTGLRADLAELIRRPVKRTSEEFTTEERAMDMISYGKMRMNHASQQKDEQGSVYWSGYIKGLKELLAPQAPDSGNAVEIHEPGSEG